jgi:hypothetical protein|tara:strand:+ start:164 stop:415 length:252 start_codon:yes stop_codon:yes gene_type:complete
VNIIDNAPTFKKQQGSAMNTTKLFELKKDLKRLQRNYQTNEELLATCESQYVEKVKADIFEIENVYCDTLEEIRKIKTFLYCA